MRYFRRRFASYERVGGEPEQFFAREARPSMVLLKREQAVAATLPILVDVALTCGASSVDFERGGDITYTCSADRTVPRQRAARVAQEGV